MCRLLTLYDRFSRAILRGITALGSLICVWGSVGLVFGGWFMNLTATTKCCSLFLTI